MKKPAERRPPTESDSDTAPCSAIINKKEESAEERQIREAQNLEESARLAATLENEGSSRKLQSARNTIGEKKVDRSDDSSEDEQWFAK